MASVGLAWATLEDLYREPGKAELVGGRIVRLMAAGHRPNRVAGRIYRSLDDHAEQTRDGVACTDNMGFAVRKLPSGRESFRPMLPTHPCGRIGDGRQTRRLFAAGTLVVWDGDPIGEQITAYRLEAPEKPIVYHRGDMAQAEPAVPGWRVTVDLDFQLAGPAEQG
jgi:Putative restriction endonuclease